ncbi:MAG: hypothetical protein J0L70_26710 [Leptolyngbya sp. UWPOB_LEPTO1]|uniref:hypothetical protein n=1 Tax=Leptolyngbya sp. UWPOB_LEPTO1 TaxID=2815653 RepID=UPI001ACCEC93|nr:hypothetical protein [Leptolyngbya sp. UWPOB_LEPTO1]MBN8564132.1 hypothetical protein [Leptolyngbya sp. UWPOB_LEPTO1]
MQQSSTRIPKTGAAFKGQAQTAPKIGDELERLRQEVEQLRSHQKTTYSKLIDHQGEHATRLELQATQDQLTKAQKELQQLKDSRPDELAILLTSVGASLLVGLGVFTMLATRISQTTNTHFIYQERLR